MQGTNFTQEWKRQDVSASQPSLSLLGRMENSTGTETLTDQRDAFYFKTGDAFYSQTRLHAGEPHHLNRDLREGNGS